MSIVADPAEYDPSDIYHVDLAKIRWRATGAYCRDADSRARLTAVIQIGGADHFLEAIEVASVDGMQFGAEGVEDEFAELDTFAGGEDGPFETVRIEGRVYALSMLPFRR